MAMAISVSSYEIIFPDSRVIVMVNPQPGERARHLLVVDPSPTLAAKFQAYEDIETMLFDDGGPAYAMYLMEVKKNDQGSVAGTPVSLGGSHDDVLDHETCAMITSYILNYEARRAEETILEDWVASGGDDDDEEEEEKEEEAVCVICQEEIQTGEICAALECQHGYHKRCIQKWLKRKNDCPICRAIVHPFSTRICLFGAGL